MLGYSNASASAALRVINYQATFSSNSDSATNTAYPYKCDVPITGCTADKQATVTFGDAEAKSGNYAPFCETFDDVVRVFSKVNTAITIPAVVVENVSNFYDVDGTPTSGSTRPITSGGVYSALGNYVTLGTTQNNISGLKTFTNDVKLSGNRQILNTVDDSLIRVQGGSVENNGGRLVLSGKSRSGFGGYAELVGADGTNTYSLTVTPTGVSSLKVNGNINGYGTVYVQSNNGNYAEGIRVNRSTAGWATFLLGSEQNSVNGVSGGWWFGRDTGARLVVSGKDSSYSTALFYGTYDSSTGYHTLHVPHYLDANASSSDKVWCTGFSKDCYLRLDWDNVSKWNAYAKRDSTGETWGLHVAYADNAGYATSAGSASTATSATTASGATWAANLWTTSHNGSWWIISDWDGSYFQTQYRDSGSGRLPINVGRANNAGALDGKVYHWGYVSRYNDYSSNDVYHGCGTSDIRVLVTPKGGNTSAPSNGWKVYNIDSNKFTIYQDAGSSTIVGYWWLAIVA